MLCKEAITCANLREANSSGLAVITIQCGTYMRLVIHCVGLSGRSFSPSIAEWGCVCSSGPGLVHACWVGMRPRLKDS